MRAGNISDTKRTLVGVSSAQLDDSVATLLEGLFSDWTLYYEWV